MLKERLSNRCECGCYKTEMQIHLANLKAKKVTKGKEGVASNATTVGADTKEIFAPIARPAGPSQEQPEISFVERSCTK